MAAGRVTVGKGELKVPVGKGESSVALGLKVGLGLGVGKGDAIVAVADGVGVTGGSVGRMISTKNMMTANTNISNTVKFHSFLKFILFSLSSKLPN